MSQEIPKIIIEVGFDFSWDESKVWRLDVPVTKMNISKLTWHFDIPFLCLGDGVYNLSPNDVMKNPTKYQSEYERTMKADMQYPIDIMENKGKWLILDGLHRLMQTSINGLEEVNERIVPRERIPEIVSD